MDQDEKRLREQLSLANRIVVKIGTHVLVDKRGKPNLNRIKKLVDDMIFLHQQKKQIIFVSSGAIGAGMQALNMTKRPTLLPELQMAAAVGQTRLLSLYDKLFLAAHIQISQVLLTHADLKHRQRHLNARNTLLTLLNHRIIPIINENDVVAVDEIKVGDNDVLSALVSILLEADLLILLTTPDGLRKPLASGKTARISYLPDITQPVLNLAFGKRSELSTGGMSTKLQAAKMASTIGTKIVIASGFKNKIIQIVAAGNSTGTLIATNHTQKTTHRKRWLAYFHKPEGSLIVDEGAQNALCQQNKSLLPVGIKTVTGQFQLGAMVNILNQGGKLIGQGLVEYSSHEINLIKGVQTHSINEILGYKDYDEVVHRDNLVILD